MKLHTTRITTLAATTLAVCAGAASIAGCSRTRVEGGTLNLHRDVSSSPSRDQEYKRTRIRVTLPGADAVPLPETPRHRFDDQSVPAKPMSWTDDASAFDEVVTLGLFGARDDGQGPSDGGASRVKVNGNEIVAPHGAIIDVDVEHDTDKVGASGRTTQTGDSKGPTFSLPGEADVKGLSAGASGIDFGGVDREGNESHGSASASASSLEKVTGVKGLNFFHVIGGLAIIGAGVFFWISKNWKAALLIAGVGVLSICVGTIVNEITVWHALGVIAAGLAAVVVFAWLERGNADAKLALDRVTRAVEQSGAAGKAVKAKIKAQAKRDGTKKAVDRGVDAAKKRMQIVDDEDQTTTTPSGMEASGAIGAAPGVSGPR